MLVAPLPSDMDITAKPAIKPVEYLPLKVGDAVRILSSHLVGQIATVTEILPPQTLATSRLQLTHCLLQPASGGTIKLPITNIEVVTNR
jgi:hypothetical protein